jgi:hypothetical protein
MLLGAAGCVSQVQQKTILYTTPQDDAASAVSADGSMPPPDDGAEPQPEWLRRSVSGGYRAVETMEAFAGFRCFTSMESGVRFAALEQWQAGLLPQQELPVLASRRLRNAMISAANGDPDGVYGRFFEQAVKAAAGLWLTEAAAAESFWTQSPASAVTAATGVGTSAGQEYRYYILITIPADTFDAELTSALSAALEASTDLTSVQKRAATDFIANLPQLY